MREYCQNAKEKTKLMLVKLPYVTVICVLSFRLPAKVAKLFWKLMKQKSERLEMSLTYCMAKIRIL